MADAKGDQCGMEQLSGVWSLAGSAVAWNLPQLYLQSGMYSILLGLFDKYLGTPDASGKFSQEPMGSTRQYTAVHGCSA